MSSATVRSVGPRRPGICEWARIRKQQSRSCAGSVKSSQMSQNFTGFNRRRSSFCLGLSKGSIYYHFINYFIIVVVRTAPSLVLIFLCRFSLDFVFLFIEFQHLCF